MSMFRPPSSGGGSGLTPAEYNNLTQDGDLSQAVSDINGHTSWAVNSISNGIQSLLYTQANVPSGQIQMRFAPNGQASAGWTKLGGVAIPASFFNTVRSAVLPYAAGSSGLTSNAIAQALRVTIGDVGYFVSGTSVRALNLGTMGWQDEAAVPQPSSLSPTCLCPVGGKVAAFGIGTGASTGNQLYLFDPVARSWSAGQNMPSYLNSSGCADLSDGRMATFGGRNVAPNTSPTATNIVDTVRIYDEPSNTWTTLAQALPVRMFEARAVPMPDGSVLLFPRQTSDGTALLSQSQTRGVYRWTEAGGAVALDSLSLDVSNSPWLVVARADGKVIYVPTTAPSSGGRARLLDPSAPSGSQWTSIDWSFNENATYGSAPICCPLTQTASGFALTSQTVATSISGLFATFVEAPTAGYSQVIYEYKT